jgi:hypothetical protein
VLETNNDYTLIIVANGCGYLPENLQIHNIKAMTRILCPLFQSPKLVVEKCVEENEEKENCENNPSQGICRTT